ncbi:MAG: BtrH N-terminal domain-containing protein [Chloroflexota bacterium]
MAILTDYNAFSGRHPETGTVRNILAYQGVIAPHTGAPISEALLMGISGGAAFGYFTFEYEGYPPHIALLTRNTFDPLETLFERLAIPHDTLHTTSAKKGTQNLLDVLESGRPALVWADKFTMAYNAIPWDDRNWAVMPVVVYGLDGDTAYLADRAKVPVVVPANELQAARERIKKYKFRVITLDAPDMSRLPAAVSKGIWQCVSLYTDGPPRGKKESFGLAGLQHWADMLTSTRNKQSWARYFPPGKRLWMALAGNATQPGVFSWIAKDAGNYAERGMYADFLDEAATILDQPDLRESAEKFRIAEKEWVALAQLVLPDDVPVLKAAADLLTARRTAFLERGADALEEIQQINARLSSLQQQVTDDFPMSEAELSAFFVRMAAQVTAIHYAEQAAITHLQSAMA